MKAASTKELLAYWITEREKIRVAKEAGLSKPWSTDWVFQQTYFCNVRREDDRVTRWIRTHWSPDKIGWDDYEYAMVVARFLNWPDTLMHLYNDDATGIMHPNSILEEIEYRSESGDKVWGNAYVVTTHGIPMGKAQYLCQKVLPAAYDLLGAGRWRGAYSGPARCLALRHENYMQLEGMGSFMSAQVLADLKNTPGHPLYDADDWSTWSAPGPGSLRGLGWYFNGSADKKISPGQYLEAIDRVEFELPGDVRAMLLTEGKLNMQDLQNCLCEFDKFMRVRTGAGRSKRGYPGK